MLIRFDIYLPPATYSEIGLDAITLALMPIRHIDAADLL